MGTVLSSPLHWQLLSLTRREAFRKGASEGGVCPPGESALPLGLAARQGDVAQVQDGQRVGLCVEHPVLKRQQLIAGEKQIEIPTKTNTHKDHTSNWVTDLMYSNTSGDGKL